MLSRTFLTAAAGVLLFCRAAFAAESAVLAVRDVPDDFFDSYPHAADGTPPEGVLTVVGIFSTKTFAIKAISNVALHDAAGKPVPLVIEKASLHREFGDEITSMRFAFKIGEEGLKAGAPKLTWGPDVSVANVLVDKLTVDAGRKNSYRTFTWEARPGITGDGRLDADTQITVIVDNKADKYYLWYLLPMGLILGLLAVRKIRIR